MIVTHLCPSAAQTGEPLVDLGSFEDLPSSPSVRAHVAAALHGMLLACSRFVGKFLAQDVESFGEELAQVLPTVCRLRLTPVVTTSPGPEASSDAATGAAEGSFAGRPTAGAAGGEGAGGDQPACLHQPLAFFVSPVMARCGDRTLLAALSDTEAPEGLVLWATAACRALLCALMEARAGAHAAPSPPEVRCSTSVHTHTHMVCLIALAGSPGVCACGVRWVLGALGESALRWLLIAVCVVRKCHMTSSPRPPPPHPPAHTRT
jgi:hypothetical protein